jgi:hypothetical protein
LDRLSVPEAAQRLGVTQDAVRKRIHRDAISWEQDDDGRYYVHLYDTQDTTRNSSRATRQDTSRDTLFEVMQDQIDTLKQEVTDWKEEARRKDHLLAAALERIPAIEPPLDTPSEPREAPVSDSEDAPNNAREEESGEPRRSWWGRFFLGP